MPLPIFKIKIDFLFIIPPRMNKENYLDREEKSKIKMNA